jgi:hypothetical protein
MIFLLYGGGAGSLVSLVGEVVFGKHGLTVLEQFDVRLLFLEALRFGTTVFAGSSPMAVLDRSRTLAAFLVCLDTLWKACVPWHLPRSDLCRFGME